jgi:hypothetical protein
MSGPLTREEFDRFAEWAFRKRKPRAAPTTTFNFELAAEYGIGWFMEGDTVLLSVDGMKKARELGVVKNVKPRAPLSAT